MNRTTLLACLAVLLAGSAFAQLSNKALVPSATNPNELIIPDTGWHLWPDTQASWQNDTLYLPSQVDLSKLPVNPPTGGWNQLSASNGMRYSAGFSRTILLGSTIPSPIQ